MLRSRIRWGLRVFLLIVLISTGFLLIRWGSGNFGTVEPGKVYRSAQLSAKGLDRRIRDHGIRTVINLRGQNPDQAWYQQEKRATLAASATQIDFPMSSDQWLSREQAKGLVSVLRSSAKPILIHCEWGAERTGLVAAFWDLLREDSSLDEARAQFSTYYLFAPLKDGLVMRGHIDAYENWLRTKQWAHTPERFESWLVEDYQPGSPSREHWPCNPYPIKVVSRPSAESIAYWGEKVCR